MSEGAIQSGGVLRVTRLGVAGSGQPIDTAVREAMRTLLSEPGLTGAWFGRRTTETGEERALASMWRADDDGAARRWTAGLGVAADLDVREQIELPVVFDVRVPHPEPEAILRIYDGLTIPGQLDAYVARARAATLLDAVRPGGPLAVCMALDRPDRFVTASVWPDWASLEAYTGGDISRPLVSRDTALLAGGGPSHYEIIAPGRG